MRPLVASSPFHILLCFLQGRFVTARRPSPIVQSFQLIRGTRSSRVGVDRDPLADSVLDRLVRIVN